MAAIKVGNGGAGIVGFVQFMYQKFNEVTHNDYEFEWVKSDTEETIAGLEGSNPTLDMGWPYGIDRVCNKFKENAETWQEPSYIFRDHFLLAGPLDNPAGLQSSDKPHPHYSNDDVYAMFKKISDGKKGTVFLTRDDLSATNVLEREIFKHVLGRYPDPKKDSWYVALTGSEHYPDTALKVSDKKGYYTLSDRGIWTWADPDIKTNLKIFAEAGDDNPEDILLNACLAVILKGASKAVQDYFEWLTGDGQKYVEIFKLHEDRLYTKAPSDNLKPCDCQ